MLTKVTGYSKMLCRVESSRAPSGSVQRRFREELFLEQTARASACFNRHLHLQLAASCSAVLPRLLGSLVTKQGDERVLSQFSCDDGPHSTFAWCLSYLWICLDSVWTVCVILCFMRCHASEHWLYNIYIYWIIARFMYQLGLFGILVRHVVELFVKEINVFQHV